MYLNSFTQLNTFQKEIMQNLALRVLKRLILSAAIMDKMHQEVTRNLLIKNRTLSNSFIVIIRIRERCFMKLDS